MNGVATVQSFHSLLFIQTKKPVMKCYKLFLDH